MHRPPTAEAELAAELATLAPLLARGSRPSCPAPAPPC
ncbi:hypothetical protein STENM223S_03659 [Streptomyces tendae]